MNSIVVSLIESEVTRPILESTPQLPGHRIEIRRARTVDENSRAMQRGEFHVAEMSFATFLWERCRNGAPLLALPVFTGRRFLQSHMGTHPGSKIASPGDLAGRRVAVPQYWMTSSVWHRAILGRFYGVDPASITWLTTQAERMDLAPEGVRWIPDRDARDPHRLVLDGDADACLTPRPRHPSLAPLFADEGAEEERYFEATGSFPVMHLIVVREGLPQAALDWLWRTVHSARKYPQPSGRKHFELAGNAPSLTPLIEQAHREGLLPEIPQLDELFVATPERIPTP